MDRLVVVRRRGDVVVAGHEQAQQQPLGEARVLQLVDEHVAVASRQPLPYARARPQQAERVQHQVADVERPGVGEQALVGGVQVGELALAGALLGQGCRPGGVVAGRHKLVLEPVDALHDRP